MKINIRMDHSVVPAQANSVVHILLAITAPEAASGQCRPEVNIAAVIDRSGSMAGPKLEYAKRAVCSLIEQLAPHDRFSLVAFDDQVLPLIEGVLVKDKEALSGLVGHIVSGGNTNLSGGWLKGIELVNRAPSKAPVRAVMLLTDGQANCGILELTQLVSIGAGASKEQAIRTTCLGLGEGFNEDLLKGIASGSGGRFHYIESPELAPEIFGEELGGLLGTVAQNVEVGFDFADGITGVAQLTGFPWKIKDSACKLQVGDFHAGQTKNVLLAVVLPAVADVSDMLVATLEVTYTEILKESIEIKCQKQSLIVQVSNAIDAARPADPEVLLHIGLQRAAQLRKEAIGKLDQGDIRTATQILKAGRDELRSMATGCSKPERLEEEAQELERRAGEVHRAENLCSTRKSMVSEGTSMSFSEDEQTRALRMRRDRKTPPPPSPAGTAPTATAPTV
jgi:Ca-activated chloride channel family protein